MKGKWVYLAGAVLAGILFAAGHRLLPLLLLVFALLRSPFDRRLIIPAAAAALLGFFQAGYKEQAIATSLEEGPAELMLTFRDKPRIDGNRLRAEAVAEKEKLAVTYRISSLEEKERLAAALDAGTACTVIGKLVRPQGKRNENAFDYPEYLRGRNIHWVMQVQAFGPGTCGKERGSLLYTLRNIRAQTLAKVADTFPEPLVPYANALLFGDRDAFPEEEILAYQRLGIVHLLAISGLHVGLIAGGLYFLLIRAGLAREAVFWLMLALLPTYAVLSGGNPPVIRAAGMFLILLAAKGWRMPLTTLDALSISFIAFVLHDPFILQHAGFQLSYAVSFGIVMSSARILRSLGSLKSLAVLSVISLLSSFPILAWHFYEFSLLSLIANILYIPFYSFIVLPGIIALFFMQPLPAPLFTFFASLLERLVSFSEKVAVVSGNLPFAVLLTGKPSQPMLFFTIASVLCFFLLFERGRGLLFSSVPLLFFLTIQLFSVQYSPEGEVVFIDVGQGDSTLIKLPYNRGVYMIDTGGTIHFPAEEWEKRHKQFDVGKDVVLPLLKSKGIGRIDKLILTHSDADHMGSAKELLGKIAIREIYIPPSSWEKPIMRELLEEVRSHRIPVYEVMAGSGWENRSGVYRFVYPFDEQYKGNDSSLVLWAEFGGKSWLFTGDLEQDGEGEMVREYKGLEADVLKAGHHGSRTSSTPPFLEMVRPETVIISAGAENRYGHPHPEVLDNLEKTGAAIYRTDLHGGIHYSFRESGGTFRHVIP